MSKRYRRKKKFPEGEFEAKIESLSDDGRGIARIDGKTTFIRNALPDESVKFQYTSSTSKYDEGKAVEILEASSDRVTPACEYSQICGGCSLHHMSSHAQRESKQAAVKRLFSTVSKIDVESFWAPLIGPTVGYRTKARLGVRYVQKKEKLLVGFREVGSNKLADIDRCVVLDPRVGEKIKDLKELIQSLEAYDHIPQIEVACGDDDVTLVVRHMNPLSEKDIVSLKDFAKLHEFQIMGQPKGPDTIYPLWPEKTKGLTYQLCEGRVKHTFEPLDFTQVNQSINEQMIEQAIKLLDVQPKDRVLDLFCGLGNFTLPLATKSQFVTGVEGSQSLVERAKQAAVANQLSDRVSFYYANLYENWWNLPWARQPVDKLLLDPPRSGAELVVENIQYLNPKKILYVSCHAAALARDAGILQNEKGYELKGIGIMDMFPNTTHVETMALFEKKSE
ncbi:MAG: 23S rRNA (uracil(1939)-C(5))-methyltransferase RlmD [Legionellales bacterium]|nr:23S rRNA (uracil(1939)-C(5))-methyltransferase RlmD [Legionellales bacterium]|tara:strand:- start:289 stop:1635 length:1347 start_codon:yes stop_codon:yes gene_type:complete